MRSRGPRLHTESYLPSLIHSNVADTAQTVVRHNTASENDVYTIPHVYLKGWYSGNVFESTKISNDFGSDCSRSPES